MKQIIGTLLTVSTLWVSSSVYAQDVSKGEQLHAAKCQACHDSSVYTRANRFVKNKAALQAQVSRCSNPARADWSTQQIDDVVNYLDSKFYKF